MAMNDVECCEENCIHAELLKKAREKMPDEDELYDLAELFKVLVILPESGSCLYYLARKYVCVIWQRR